MSPAEASLSGERDICSKLELAVITENTIRNSVLASDGLIVRLHASIWFDSPVLKKHQVSGKKYLKLSVPGSGLQTLERAYLEGVVPEDDLEYLYLLMVTRELEMWQLHSYLAKFFFTTGERTQFPYPANWSVENAMECFKIIVDSPLRTLYYYGEQIRRLLEHVGGNREILQEASKAIRERVAAFDEIGLEGIPVDFNVRSIPLVTYRRTGKIQTCVFNGMHLTPVDIVGKHFSLDKVRAKDHFYLKYGSYILYKLKSRVFRKNLRNDDDPVVVLRHCSDVSTRGGHVFAVTEGAKHDRVMMWTDDEKFVRIYQTSRGIEVVDFDCEKRHLALQNLEDSILLFYLTSENNLILLHEMEVPHVTNLLLFREQLLLVVEKHREDSEDKQLWLKTFDIEESGCVAPLSETLVVDWRSDPWFGIGSAGGYIFVCNSDNLRVAHNYPSFENMNTLASPGEFLALSELTTFP